MATKMYIPRLRPGIVVRRRLLDRLGAGAAPKLVLVSAPPGFGKTTLLAEWAGTTGLSGRVAWLSLDTDDNDPGTFWSYLVASLGTVMPRLGEAGRDLAVAGRAPTPEAITVLLNELSEESDEVWLVLDDFHVIENHDVRDGVRFLLGNLPPQVHVLIGTRADPDLPLSMWRVRGELVEVRAADLRFTRDESGDFLRSATGLELTPADVDALGERTEGWIAALQLAALSLHGRTDPSGFIGRFAGDDRYVVDYLMDEVLTHQPGDVREFLLSTALLERLTGDLCDAVTGRANGRRMLAGLERANLFVVALDDQLSWFRYHHLFADVLRMRLLAERADEVPVLHGRASNWYEQNGFTDDAIRHALAARDHDRAARLVELAIPDARRDRRDTAMIGWLRALPDEAVRRNPVLTTFRGWADLAAGDLSEMELRLDHAEALLAAVPSGSSPWAETEELRTLPATIALYRAALAQAHGDLPGVARQARHALEVAGADDHFSRGGAGGFLALAAWSEGDISLAVETFTAALASLHAAGAFVDELNSTALLAEMWTVAGRPSKAREVCRRALAASEAIGLAASRATADLHVELAELDLDAGDPASAEQHLAVAKPLAEREPNSESRYRWFVAAARRAEADGDHVMAIARLDEADRYYRPGYYPNVRPIPAMRAGVWIAAGHLARAADWAAESGVAVTDEACYLREYEHLTLARLLLAGDPDRVQDVVQLLSRLEAAAASSRRGGSLVEIRRLLAQAAQLAPGEPGSRSTVPGQSLNPLTQRELQVLRLLGSELSGPEIARELFVSRNTLRTHTKHIFSKLDVTTRRAAVARAHERGLI